MRCHRKSNQAVSPEVASCLRSTLAAVPFKAATQHPGSSSPPSLLRWGCCSRMCIASFSNSSLLVLAWSITVASSHLIGWYVYGAGNNKQGTVTTLTKWPFATHVRLCTISLYWNFNFDCNDSDVCLPVPPRIYGLPKIHKAEVPSGPLSHALGPHSTNSPNTSLLSHLLQQARWTRM